MDLAEEFRASGVAEVLAELDRELVGLAPVKAAIRETAALLLVAHAERSSACRTKRRRFTCPSTGNPGVGKTTVALKMAGLLHRRAGVRKGPSRLGHARRPRRPVHQPHRAKDQGGPQEGDGRRPWFIDEAYYLYRPDNERDYGQEAIEILLQVMENNRDDPWSFSPAMATGWTDLSSSPGFLDRASPITSSSRTTATKNCSRLPATCSRRRNT